MVPSITKIESYSEHIPISIRFTGSPESNPLTKSLFRTKRFLASHCYYPIPSVQFTPMVVKSNGEINDSFYTHSQPAIIPKPIYGYGSIYHYFFRSFEEFIWKCSRNTGDQPIDKSKINGDRINLFVEKYRIAHDCISEPINTQYTHDQARPHTIVGQEYNIIRETVLRDQEYLHWHSLTIKKMKSLILQCLPQIEELIDEKIDSINIDTLKVLILLTKKSCTDQLIPTSIGKHNEIS
jgi:hypothetical protein